MNNETVRVYNFDIQPGMDVRGGNDQKIGVVRAVEGFGPHGPDETDEEIGRRVTTAQTSTGYFVVDRSDTVGASSDELSLPFHAIRRVDAGHGVYLTERAVADLQRGIAPSLAGDSTPRRDDSIRSRLSQLLGRFR